MWFLILEILLLLILAALFGAMLTYWWMKRGVEDVSESYESLMQYVNADQGRHYLTRRDLREELSAIGGGGNGMGGASVSPALETKLKELEQKLTERIAGIGQGATAPAAGMTPVSTSSIEQRLANIEQQLPRVIRESVQGGVMDSVRAQLSNIEANLSQLSPERSGLSMLVQRFSQFDPNSTDVDLTPALNRIGALEAKLESVRDDLKVPDTFMQEYVERTTHIESGIAALQARFSAMDEFLREAGLPLEGLQDNLRSLDTALSGAREDLKDLASLPVVETKLLQLEKAVTELHNTDLTPVLDRMRAQGLDISELKSKLGQSKDVDLQPILERLDMGAVQNRLTSLEYGLAALLHMLRDSGGLGGSAGSSPIYDALDAANGQMPPSPEAALDPVDIARRPDGKANLLQEAAFGKADDLEQIHGVGPMLRQLLNDIGVFYFWQIAEWDEDDINVLDELLVHYSGRIESDNWVAQCENLAKLDKSAKRPMAIG